MPSYLNNIDSEWYKQRISRVMLIIAAVFAVLLVRLFYLQAIHGEQYRRLSQNNSIRLQSIDAPRGEIFDRHGRLLVDNRPSFNLYITRKDAEPVPATLARLTRHLRLPRETLTQRLESCGVASNYKPLLLRADIGRDTLAAVEVHRYDLPGISVRVKPVRHYLYPRSAAHLLGYMGEIDAAELDSGRFPGCRSGDLIGKFGAEKAFDRYLRGRRGGRQVEVNASGQVVRVRKTVEAQAGHSLFLTIDQGMQAKAEALLEGLAGAVVALEPSTGEVLCLASSPSFDQNAFIGGISRAKWNELVSDPFHPMENKALQGEYPPGSTYKIVTALAGLEEGVIDAQSEFFCPGYLRFGDRIFRCWRRGGHGRLAVVSALAESCDVFFYQVGLKLGVDRLARYAGACGLGAPTGIHLKPEADGLVPTADWKRDRTGRAWQQGETLSVAIGQSYNLVTPLQLAVLTAAVANGGVRYKPLVVRRIVTADGREIATYAPQPQGRLPVSEQTLATLRQGLYEVVNSPRGTARRTRLADVAICGKTGTSQVIGRREDDEPDEKRRAYHLRPHAWFVAYAPAADPRIAIAVIVEHGEHGSSSAAPIARALIERHLREENVPVREVAVLR